jgi:hypothetical protein
MRRKSKYKKPYTPDISFSLLMPIGFDEHLLYRSVSFKFVHSNRSGKINIKIKFFSVKHKVV